jgi:dihydroorotase
MAYDLIIKGGHVIDPSQGLDGINDIGIAAGRITGIRPNLETTGCSDVRDAQGTYICPGLVDLHGHWYEGGLYGIDVRHCLNHGVTTAVDAGSTGFANFPEFRRATIETSPVNLLAFIHISFMGLHATFVEELLDLRYARPSETAETIMKHRERAVGVKIRIGSSITGTHGTEALEKALSAAKEAKVPLMVHISKGANEKEILQRLRPGDIVTHCFHGRGNGLLAESGKGLIPLVGMTRERGVLFDIGHGCGSFSWETAERAYEAHFYPDTLSTDLHRYCIGEPLQVSLPGVMSKFLCLGLSLQDVVLKTTMAPARALGRENEIGTLRPGTRADLLQFELVSGDYKFTDIHLQTRKGSKMIKPRLVLKDGISYQPGTVKAASRDLFDFDRKELATIGVP